MEEENKQEIVQELKPKLIKGVELAGIELVRICYSNKIHNKYEWHDGENIDTLPFLAKGECKEGGLYFTTIEYLLYYNDYTCSMSDDWFVTLTVDPNEDVWQEPNGKWKAHRVMVTSMTRIKDMPEEVLYRMVTSFILRRTEWVFKPFNPAEREELWCKLLEARPHFLQFVRNQTYEICRTAVAYYGCLIQFVYDPAMVVKLASEFDFVDHITDWTCDLVDAFLASGQYTFKFEICHDDGRLYPYQLEDLKKMCHSYILYEPCDYTLRVVISKTGSSSETCIMFPTLELLNHIYDKVYKNVLDSMLSENK